MKSIMDNFLYKKNLYNLDKIIELRENWEIIFPERDLQASPRQLLAVNKEGSSLTLFCKAEFFLSCSTNREKIKNRLNIYFSKNMIESIRVLVD
jgi:hypothetical protein